jgi:eukaryotic-like serine/threonine-protein kinase
MADERKLIAADPATGGELWKMNMEFLVFGNNAYSDSMLYVGTTIGKIHGKSLKSGDEVWSFATESYQKARFKYFKQDDSYRDDIYDIIKSNEQFLDVEVELGGIFSTPWISANTMIFSSTNGTIYCLER